MALIFLGSSECPLCNKILQKGDEIIGLPPIAEIGNPLYRYFDCGFHKKCFDAWDKKQEIEAILSRESERLEKEKRRFST